MPNVIHYRGNVIDALHEQAEQKHSFGPDMCGTTAVAWHDIPTAMRLGMYDVVRRFIAQPMSRGAFYTCEGADHDQETGVTTAYFAPYVDPLQRLRFHGGAEDDVIVRQPTVHKHDSIGGR